jgi:hypothetical protein
MIRLDCAGRASAISLLATLVVLFGVSSADARKVHHHARATIPAHHTRVAIPVPTARPSPDFSFADTALQDSGVVLSDPTLSVISQEAVTLADTPTIIKPGRHIYCVEFARLVSGIAIFGDARTWWEQAHASYAQAADPTPGAVMVFAGRKKMTRGHVAVVKRVVSNREVLVDHANWGRDGKIYLNAPVIDVSANNDWSTVKVWNTRAGTMGTSVYSLKGFISQRIVAVN